MKIQPPLPWEPLASGQTPSVRDRGSEADFGRALKDAIGRSEAGAAAPASGCAAGAAVGSPDVTGPVSLPERLDRLLDAVESYRETLGDTRRPSAELRPLLEALERQARPLQDALDRLPVQHPLRPVLNETLVAVAVEKARFDRGDYGA